MQANGTGPLLNLHQANSIACVGNLNTDIGAILGLIVRVRS